MLTLQLNGTCQSILQCEPAKNEKDHARDAVYRSCRKPIGKTVSKVDHGNIGD